MKRRMYAVLIALVLSLQLGIAAAEALPAEEPAELYGWPWVNSTVIGNLPQAAPDICRGAYNRRFPAQGAFPM